MFYVVVQEKDTLQVVEDDLDGPVGGVPHSGVIAPPGGDDLYGWQQTPVQRTVASPTAGSPRRWRRGAWPSSVLLPSLSTASWRGVVRVSSASQCHSYCTQRRAAGQTPVVPGSEAAESGHTSGVAALWLARRRRVSISPIAANVLFKSVYIDGHFPRFPYFGIHSCDRLVFRVKIEIHRGPLLVIIQPFPRRQIGLHRRKETDILQ